MRIRKMDVNNDMTFGHSLRDFWINVPDGVGQAILTRLELFQGEWAFDTREGTPWNTQILGHRTEVTRDPAIQLRILGTTGVTDISDYFSVLDRDSRKLKINASVNTQFGQVKLVESF